MIIKYKKNWKDILWNKMQLELYNLQYKTYCYAKKNTIKLLLLLNDVIELHHIFDFNGNQTREIRFVHRHCHERIHSTKKI